jgi:hypothetical protein
LAASGTTAGTTVSVVAATERKVSTKNRNQFPVVDNDIQAED